MGPFYVFTTFVAVLNLLGGGLGVWLYTDSTELGVAVVNLGVFLWIMLSK